MLDNPDGQCEDGGRGQNDAVTSQGKPEMLASDTKASSYMSQSSYRRLEETRSKSPFQPPEGVWPCQHIGFQPKVTGN